MFYLVLFVCLLQERVVGAEGGVFGPPEAVYDQPEEEYL